MTRTEKEKAPEAEEDVRNRGQRPEQEVEAPGVGTSQTMETMNRESERQMRDAKKAIENIDESLLPDVPDVVQKVKGQIKALQKNGLLGSPDAMKMKGHFG